MQPNLVEKRTAVALLVPGTWELEEALLHEDLQCTS